MRASILTCQARIEGDELIIRNSLFERSWQIKKGFLYAKSFKDLTTNYEWLAKQSVNPSPCPPIEKLPEEDLQVSIRCQVLHPSPVSAEALEATLTSKGKNHSFVYRFLIYPQVSGVTMQLTIDNNTDSITANSDSETPAIIPMGDEKTLVNQKGALPPFDGLEHFNLAPQHIQLTQVIFQDITDRHNELAQELHWLLHPNEAQIPLMGNLFFVEDTLNQSGLIFLKEAPLPHARPVKSWADLRVHGHANYSSKIKVAEFNEKHERHPLAYQVGFFGHGLDKSVPVGYRWVVLTYSGGQAGRTQTLQNYQRQWRLYAPGRDGLILSNTWGDRSMNSRVNEAFILKEVEACARLGVDIMQIDDGWERGLDNAPPSGSTDLWHGIWKTSDRYWLPHPTRLPNGLDPIAKECQKQKIQMGIWYVVDSYDNYANWRLDLERLMELHHEQGVNNFKFDGVSITSKLGEKNFNQLITELQTQSKNQIVIDLDITAGLRHGYFGLLENGPLFVENRYSDWHGYWPHQTLRNLWTLTQYIDPLRLRFEFLNQNRNLPFYSQDSLAPSCYESDYLFATTMFASTLAWFETQHYPPASFKKVAKLIKVWKQHRENVFNGSIFPIGAQPNGTSWTGFCSVAEDKNSAYVLIFRELNNLENQDFILPLLNQNSYTVQKLAGQGTAKLSKNILKVKIPNALNYLFLKIAIKA